MMEEDRMHHALATLIEEVRLLRAVVERALPQYVPTAKVANPIADLAAAMGICVEEATTAVNDALDRQIAADRAFADTLTTHMAMCATCREPHGVCAEAERLLEALR